jgi:hypothetical protein
MPICSTLKGPATTIEDVRYTDLMDIQLRIEPIVDTIGYGSRHAGDMKQAQTVVGNLISAVRFKIFKEAMDVLILVMLLIIGGNL